MVVGAYTESLESLIAAQSEADTLLVDLELLEASVTVFPSRLYLGHESVDAFVTVAPSISVVSTGSTVLFWSIEVNGERLEQKYDLEHARFTDEKGKRSDYFDRPEQ